ncbi:hypothetical protein HA402_015905 [Bradysia odoriphaga]|nr:hypothetical protein HA402_015905 [Bradysia odoriphaga]
MIFVVTICLLLLADRGLADHFRGQGQDDIRSKMDTIIANNGVALKIQINSSIPMETSNENATDLTDARMAMIKTHILSEEEALDYEEIDIEPNVRQAFAKQIGLPSIPSNPVGLLVSRLPCTCQSGVCGCCTGVLLSAFRTKGCMNITYIPEEFAFEVKMMMNDAVLYKTRMSGRNPRPICVTPPRIGLIEICAVFHDIYFVGRNMHVCLNMEANFQGYELFDRSFDCMRIGDQGVKIVKPEDGAGLPGIANGNDAIVDAGNDDIEDYDENLVRKVG